MKKIFYWFWQRRWYTKLIIILLIAISSFIIYRSTRPKTTNYVTDTVKRAEITEVVSESGIIEIASKTDVFSPTRGIITELYVKNGDIVGIDQPLFTVKSTATQDQKAAAYANYIKARDALNAATTQKQILQSQLEQARKAILDAQKAVNDKNDRVAASQPNPATLRQYTQLEIQSIDSALTSARYNFDIIEKQYIESDLAITSAKATLSSAQLSYDSTKDRIVKSPSIGTIANLSVKPGDSVTSSSLESGSVNLNGLDTLNSIPVLSVANFTSNRIVISLNETDINKIIVGQKASIYPESDKSRMYQGSVERIDEIGYADAGVVKYNTYISVQSPDNYLKSGMTVDVDIITAIADNVLSVPNAAVKPYQGGRAVRVVDQNNQLKFIPVKIGLKGEQRTQIIEGISEGESVVISLTNEQIQRGGFRF